MEFAVDRFLEVLPTTKSKKKRLPSYLKKINLIQALELANDYRNEGKLVTLQAKKGLLDEEAFTKLFSNVVYVNQEDKKQ